MVTSDPLIGKRLGDYLIEGVLGTGGMARVYRGYDDALDRYAAIKVIEPQLVASAEEDEYRERFLREARAIARLSHPNIVGVYQFNQVGNLYYIAMEYVQGRNLRDILKSYLRQGKVIPTDELMVVMHDIASALDYAHKNNIIHRDVKPSNIIVKEDGHAVLTDFGLALNAVEGTIGNTFGSVHYIAPEQAISSAQAVPQSDQYSLAIVSYELLTGRVPFDDASAMSVALKHISDPPPPPTELNPNIPQGVENAMLKALDKDLNKRFPTTIAFVEAMQNVFAQMQSKDISLPANLSPAAAVAPTTLLPPEEQGVAGDENARTVPGTESRPNSIPATSQAQASNRRRWWVGAAVVVVALLAAVIGALLVLPNLQGAAAPTEIAQATTPPPTQDEGDGLTQTAAVLAAAVAETETEEIVPTDEPTATDTDEPSATPTAEATEEPTATDTETPAPTNTPSPTATPTEEPSATPTQTQTPTHTPSNTPTNTPTPTERIVATATPQLVLDPEDEEDTRQVLLRYDGRIIVVGNRDPENRVDLDDLVFVLVEPDDEGEMQETVTYELANDTFSTNLFFSPDGRCFQILDGLLFSSPPVNNNLAEEFCQSTPFWVTTSPPFWVSAAEEAYFEVRLGPVDVIQRCPANMPRTRVELRCTVDLNALPLR